MVSLLLSFAIISSFAHAHAAFAATTDTDEGATCPAGGSDPLDYMTCSRRRLFETLSSTWPSSSSSSTTASASTGASTTTATSTSSGGSCPSCTCNDAVRRLEEELGAPSRAGRLRGPRDGRVEVVVERELGGKWCAVESWAHYWCGFQRDVSLAETGQVAHIQDRWETGGGMGGNGIVDDIKSRICDHDELGGSCGCPNPDTPRSKCEDAGLCRPGPLACSYWIGGFRLVWAAAYKGTRGCNKVYGVTLTFNDSFDCDPGMLMSPWSIGGSARRCGIAGPYDVFYEWEIEIECEGTCPPTKKPTEGPTRKPAPSSTSSTSSTTSSGYKTSTSSTSSTTSSGYGTSVGTDSASPKTDYPRYNNMFP